MAVIQLLTVESFFEKKNTDLSSNNLNCFHCSGFKIPFTGQGCIPRLIINLDWCTEFTDILFSIRAVTACVIEHKVAAEENPVLVKKVKNGKKDWVEGASRMLVKEEGPLKRQVCLIHRHAWLPPPMSVSAFHPGLSTSQVVIKSAFATYTASAPSANVFQALYRLSALRSVLQTWDSFNGGCILAHHSIFVSGIHTGDTHITHTEDMMPKTDFKMLSADLGKWSD